jgi:hypothetical protein
MNAKGLSATPGGGFPRAMNPMALVTAMLGPGRLVNGQLLFRCPAHEDRHPSLSIRELRDGTLLVFCHAGCLTEDVLDCIGLTMADLYPPRSRAW